MKSSRRKRKLMRLKAKNAFRAFVLAWRRKGCPIGSFWSSSVYVFDVVAQAYVIDAPKSDYLSSRLNVRVDAGAPADADGFVVGTVDKGKP